MEYTKTIKTIELEQYINRLLKEMKRKHYSECEIHTMNKVWQKLLLYSEKNANDSFNEDYRQKFITEIYALDMQNRDSMYRITRAMNMLSDFIYFNVIFRQYCTPKTSFSEEYKEPFQSFINVQKKRNLAKGTIKQQFARLIRFHDYLVDTNVRSLEELKPEHLRLYVLSLARYSTTYTSETIRLLRRFLDYAYENNYCNESLSDCIPHVKNLRQQKLPLIFTAEEIKKLLSSVDRNNPIGKRDYAILLLAARTGLRTSDIRNLEYQNIDWDQKLINIVQVKTQKALSLPLLEDVGWAIIDYLKNGRPETTCKKIFVQHSLPYGELTSLHNIVPRQMRKAGIKTPVEKRIGMHSFRHSLATKMLEQDVPLPIVSQTLGHADITSTEVYLRISIKQLAKCGLEVEL